MRKDSLIVKDNEAPRRPDKRDFRFTTTPFGGIFGSLRQAAGYSSEGE